MADDPDLSAIARDMLEELHNANVPAGSYTTRDYLSALEKSVKDRQAIVLAALKRAQDEACERAAKHYERRADVALNSLHCGSCNEEYHEAHRLFNRHKVTAADIRALKHSKGANDNAE